MFLTEFFGFFSLSALVMWGFLMAFFFNVFVFSIGVKRNTTLLASSFILFISYSSSDYFLTWLSIYEITYLDWALYDLVTLIALAITYKLVKKTTPSFLYLIFGLTINMNLLFFMYVDVFMKNNNTPWFFWDVYTFGVTCIDFIMIVALIVDRDFLGIHILKNKLFGQPDTNSENNFS
mgnify:CR=1 FL=1|tara:strand:+ start:86 stop:619 length:534 start_codon:yes stop_codon:yes gene_type:complete